MSKRALERLSNLAMDLDLIRDHSAPAEKLAAGIAEFETYIRNNQESTRLPDFAAWMAARCPAGPEPIAISS
jgi:hypothetical protein